MIDAIENRKVKKTMITAENLIVDSYRCKKKFMKGNIKLNPIIVKLRSIIIFEKFFLIL